MSLRDIAQADVRSILSDAAFGAALPLKITNPSGGIANINGWSNDIGLLIDPDTGQAVSGRFASCAFTFADLVAGGITDKPANIPEANLKPWRVEFTNEQGVTYIFKIVETQPDQSLGYVTCTLELYL